MKKHPSQYLTATRQFVGDGHYWLMLRMANMVALEKRFDLAMSRVYASLIDGLYEDAHGKMKLYGGADIKPAILNEILRQALQGGNSGPDVGEGEEVGPQRAEGLVDLYGYPERPIEEVAAIVYRVLHAAVVGDPEQRAAMPEKAAEADARSAELNRVAGQLMAEAAERNPITQENTER